MGFIGWLIEAVRSLGRDVALLFQGASDDDILDLHGQIFALKARIAVAGDGVQQLRLDAQQLAIVAGEWQDQVDAALDRSDFAAQREAAPILAEYSLEAAEANERAEATAAIVAESRDAARQLEADLDRLAAERDVARSWSERAAIDRQLRALPARIAAIEATLADAIPTPAQSARDLAADIEREFAAALMDRFDPKNR